MAGGVRAPLQGHRGGHQPRPVLPGPDYQPRGGDRPGQGGVLPRQLHLLRHREGASLPGEAQAVREGAGQDQAAPGGRRQAPPLGLHGQRQAPQAGLLYGAAH